MSHGQAAPKVEHWQKHWTGLKEENGRISFTFSYEDELEHLDKILKYVARYVLSYFFSFGAIGHFTRKKTSCNFFV